MKEFYFVLLIAQLFVVLISLGPLLSHGSYRQLRDTQKRQANEALVKALDIREKSVSRFLNGIGVLVLAFAIWPISTSLIHIALFFLLINLIR